MNITSVRQSTTLHTLTTSHDEFMVLLMSLSSRCDCNVSLLCVSEPTEPSPEVRDTFIFLKALNHTHINSLIKLVSCHLIMIWDVFLGVILQIIPAVSNYNLLCLYIKKKTWSLTAFRGCVWTVHDTVDAESLETC